MMPSEEKIGHVAALRNHHWPVGVGLMLEGCTKCGPIWDDWLQPQKSFRSDHL
jgi:hypothetical protein